MTYGVGLLEEYGVTLRHPFSSRITTSRHPGMRELRIQHQGRPYRVLYIFDPERNAVLLIGGDKTGNNGWYETYVPIADRIYDEYLLEREQELWEKHAHSKSCAISCLRKFGIE